VGCYRAEVGFPYVSAPPFEVESGPKKVPLAYRRNQSDEATKEHQARVERFRDVHGGRRAVHGDDEKGEASSGEIPAAARKAMLERAAAKYPDAGSRVKSRDCEQAKRHRGQARSKRSAMPC